MSADNKRVEATNAVLSAIASWGKTKSYGPSFRDIALATNLPLGTVHSICRELRETGDVHFLDHVARSLTIV